MRTTISICDDDYCHVELQVREVVKYAAERFIEVVPEIELPGHCGAALACYPELSCDCPPLNCPPLDSYSFVLCTASAYLSFHVLA